MPLVAADGLGWVGGVEVEIQAEGAVGFLACHEFVFRGWYEGGFDGGLRGETAQERGGSVEGTDS